MQKHAMIIGPAGPSRRSRIDERLRELGSHESRALLVSDANRQAVQMGWSGPSITASKLGWSAMDRWFREQSLPAVQPGSHGDLLETLRQRMQEEEPDSEWGEQFRAWAEALMGTARSPAAIIGRERTEMNEFLFQNPETSALACSSVGVAPVEAQTGLAARLHRTRAELLGPELDEMVQDGRITAVVADGVEDWMHGDVLMLQRIVIASGLRLVTALSRHSLFTNLGTSTEMSTAMLRHLPGGCALEEFEDEPRKMLIPVGPPAQQGEQVVDAVLQRMAQAAEEGRPFSPERQLVVVLPELRQTAWVGARLEEALGDDVVGCTVVPQSVLDRASAGEESGPSKQNGTAADRRDRRVVARTEHRERAEGRAVVVATVYHVRRMRFAEAVALDPTRGRTAREGYALHSAYRRKRADLTRAEELAPVMTIITDELP